MVSVIVALVLAGLLVHLIGGLFHHGRSRRRGHRVNVGWSLSRGWWASTRVFGGSYRHDL